jgi:hypothetical protein
VVYSKLYEMQKISVGQNERFSSNTIRTVLRGFQIFQGERVQVPETSPVISYHHAKFGSNRYNGVEMYKEQTDTEALYSYIYKRFNCFLQREIITVSTETSIYSLITDGLRNVTPSSKCHVPEDNNFHSDH